MLNTIDVFVAMIHRLIFGDDKSHSKDTTEPETYRLTARSA